MNLNGRFEDWPDWLPFYVAGTLTASERLAVNEHLLSCASCRAEVQAWQALADVVQTVTITRVPAHDLPPLNFPNRLIEERKHPMFYNHVTTAERSTRQHWQSLNRTGWLGLSASLLIVVLVTVLTFGTLTPMFSNPSNGVSGAGIQSSATSQLLTPQPLGALPADCPPAPLAMTVNPDIGVAVGGYPLWVVMSAYRAALPFYGEGRYTADGWGQKVLWAAQTDYKGLITVHGENLKTGAPLKFDPFPIEIGPKTTTLTIDTRLLDGSPSAKGWGMLASAMYISAAGCYSLDMNWAGGSWRIIFPAGLVSATMETATANALSTATGTPTAVTPGATVECNNPPIPLDSLFEATETALPPQPTGLAGQTPLPNPTFAPISVDQLQQRCPSPINLTVSPIPVCPTSANGLVPTASPTAAALGSVRVDCLPLGKNLYIQVCPATVPLSNSLMFRGVLGPPFPTCAATSQPYRSPTLAFSETPSAMPDPIASVTFNSGTATPMTK